MITLKWRIGTKVPINVYEGDRPICQCHTVSDAKRIVAAMNASDVSRAAPLGTCDVAHALGGRALHTEQTNCLNWRESE
jgi:hypothetical protein